MELLYFCHVRAAIKGVVGHLHALGNVNRCQTAAVGKGSPADFFHALGDGDLLQFVAAAKGFVADLHHALRQGHLPQVFAAGKGLIANADNAFCNIDRADPAAFCCCFPPNTMAVGAAGRRGNGCYQSIAYF